MAGFDLFKAAQDAVGAIADGAANVASAVGTAIGDTLAPKEEKQEPSRPEPRYTGVVRDQGIIIPKTIYVKRVEIGADGKPHECQRQKLKLSSSGVVLYASDGMLAKPACNLDVANCSVFKGGTTPGGNPVVAALLSTIFLGCAMGPVGVVLGTIAGVESALPNDVWHAAILQHDSLPDMLLQLECKQDGDTLLAFLDETMLVDGY